MIIVSQDKTETTENLELRIDCITKEDGGFPINKIETIGYCIANKKYHTILATYKTKERAKEVLEETITRYANWENMRMGQPSGICEPVYYMPEE